MYWDVGEMLFTSKTKDGWGKKTLQRLANDLKNEYTDIKGFSIRNMQCTMQFYNEYNKSMILMVTTLFLIPKTGTSNWTPYKFILLNTGQVQP